MAEPTVVYCVICDHCGIIDINTVRDLAEVKSKDHQYGEHLKTQAARVQVYEYSRTHRGTLV